MRSPKDIEKLTLQELEAISLDESIAVPPDLSERIGARISKVKNKGYTVVGAAAAVAAIAAGLALYMPAAEPKDTFDNPYQAYAELEKALTKVSEGIHKGTAMIEASESIIEKSTEIFNAK